MAEIISTNVTADQCRVHILRTQNTQGQPVILLHGARFQASTWRDLTTLDRLGDGGYRPYALDLPGFGESPRCALPPDDVIKAFIEEEALSRPVLVGPSMSGKISLDFVLNQPEMVGGLVLIGAVGVQQRREQLHMIQVPCLILWGSRDPIAPIDAGRLLHEKIPGAELEIFDNAGHPCYLDQPDLWHETLLTFMNRNFSR